VGGVGSTGSLLSFFDTGFQFFGSGTVALGAPGWNVIGRPFQIPSQKGFGRYELASTKDLLRLECPPTLAQYGYSLRQG
jgi:hypothetical protein